MLTEFLALVNPVSRVAKPRCIIKTRKAEQSIQVLLTVNMAGVTSSPA
jgi:hypothetical protein